MFFVRNIRQICHMVLKKKSFECFCTIYRHDSHLAFQILTILMVYRFEEKVYGLSIEYHLYKM